MLLWVEQVRSLANVDHQAHLNDVPMLAPTDPPAKRSADHVPVLLIDDDHRVAVVRVAR